ncbi:hypothetical protein ACOSQ3_018074 [Xanthoceras sorbifolium]
MADSLGETKTFCPDVALTLLSLCRLCKSDTSFRSYYPLHLLDSSREGCYKLNTDAASDIGKGVVNMRVIIRDWKRCVLLSGLDKLIGGFSP